MSIKIALAGNPNSGKTTLFNALTGTNQFVGNWPGVTVEKKEGKLKKHNDVIVTDLPGIYSLSPYTLEEVVARNYLVNEKPDAILNIVDGTNLERNLYLTTQLIELNIPVVIAINMMDIVKKNNDKIDIKELSKNLGCQIVEISALKADGVFEAANAAIEAAKTKKVITSEIFSDKVEAAIVEIENIDNVQSSPLTRWYGVKLFERDDKVLEQLKLSSDTVNKINKVIEKVEKEQDDDSESIITNERYEYITKILKNSYKKAKAGKLSTSDKIDKVVTNRWLALPIFALIMYIVYYVSISTIGAMGTDWVNDVLFGEILLPGLASLLENLHVASWLSGLLVDGIVSGVGAVLGFLPQMLVLFFFLAFLEASGYMARIAFVMDRIFRKFGLSGKSFIPMLIGTGCGVPGIMASRTIENERDRRMTIITTTFIPCSAKLPVISLIAGALFGGSSLVATSAYFIGISAIIVSGIILKKTKMFAGDPAPFVMELPAYHWPTLSNILHSMWERAYSFVKKAGTIILLSTIVVWFLSSFGFESGSFQMIEDIDNSLLAAIGNGIAWIFNPLGWGNWKAAVATVTGLVAKENVVTTFGQLYHFAGELSESGDEIWGELAASFTAISAYSFLVFNLLCAPCFAAIGAIKREMNNAKWTWFAIGYQCGFAYVISFIIYQLGSFFNGANNFLGAIVAALLVGGLIYLLVRPYKESEKLAQKLESN